jgi:hypothetical protein
MDSDHWANIDRTAGPPVETRILAVAPKAEPSGRERSQEPGLRFGGEIAGLLNSEVGVPIQPIGQAITEKLLGRFLGAASPLSDKGKFFAGQPSKLRVEKPPLIADCVIVVVSPGHWSLDGLRMGGFDRRPARFTTLGSPPSSANSCTLLHPSPIQSAHSAHRRNRRPARLASGGRANATFVLDDDRDDQFQRLARRPLGAQVLRVLRSK